VFELSPGQIVADKYRIDGVLGWGGMGVVVRATHVELDQKVAIKMLRDTSPDGLRRFEREAKLLVRLKSPNVARVYDVGRLDDNTPYIVMEYLEGKDLRAILEERKQLPLEESVDLMLEAMCALAEAHHMGMVHRDLKPANLFLARGPGGTTLVKVLDFGVSKAKGEGDTMTDEGVALGSPGYMAPEQIESSRDTDLRADLFSIGAILYRLVGGERPFKGDDFITVFATMATNPAPPLDRVVSRVPEEFAAIVAKCLARDRADRWPSAAPLAVALSPYASVRGRAAVEQILRTLDVTRSETPPPLVAIKRPPARRRHWPAALALGAFVIIAAVVGARLVYSRPAAPRPDPSSPSSTVPPQPAPVESTALEESQPLAPGSSVPPTTPPRAPRVRTPRSPSTHGSSGPPDFLPRDRK
jgi:serine/threonine-protein kinase